MKNHLKRGSIVLAVLGALVACQNSDLSGPVPGRASLSAAQGKANGQRNVPNGIGFLGNADNDFHAARCKDHNVASGSGVFGPSGGTLTFGDSRLVIPGGALRDTVTITATVPDPASSYVVFEPHGLQFEKPAGLLLDTTGCVLSPDGVPSVVYVNEAGEILEYIEASWDPRWKTFAAKIWHFSGYAAAF